ncbi:MAG: hypothetical protein D5S00_08735 [Tindallia sp. MSAO_Bac2]|nr:MAG: hypothetical protein D5S00_08735 [Tindallia sp. MSAO_Bac2]
MTKDQRIYLFSYGFKIFITGLFIVMLTIPVMASDKEYYEGNDAKLKQMAQQWLNENPEIRDASPQDKAAFMTRKYMEHLQRDNAPLDSTLGDSVSRRITGTTDRMTNCSQQYLNLTTLFLEAGIDDRRMGQIEAQSTGVRGLNILDVNKDHGTISVLGDDNIYRTYDVWIHAKEREDHNRRELARISIPGALSTRPPERYDVYGDFDNSKWIGMPADEWSNMMSDKGYGQYIYRSHATNHEINRDLAESLFIDDANITRTQTFDLRGNYIPYPVYDPRYTIVADNAGDAIRIRNIYDYNNELIDRQIRIERGHGDPGSDLITPLTTDPVYRVAIEGQRRINDPEGLYTYSASVSPAGEYVYEWSFGESSRTAGSAINVSYDHLNDPSEVSLGVRIMNSEGEVLVSGSTIVHISFDEEVTVSVAIHGDPVRFHYLGEDEDYVEHSFSAIASHPGQYTYHWSFGDGRTWSQSPGEGRISGGTVTYRDITDNTSFILEVDLWSEDGEFLGTDQMTVNVITDEEPDEHEEREDIMERCNEWYESGSGGAGTTRTTYDISSLPVGTSFEMRFDAYNIPDRFIVEYEGVEVYNSGWRGDSSRAADKPELYPGGVSGTGSGSVTGIFTKNESQSFTVTVIGPETGTAWQYALRANCPEIEETEATENQ